MLQVLNENTNKMHFEDILLVSIGILGSLGNNLLVRKFSSETFYF
jgi:hypothetical protein